MARNRQRSKQRQAERRARRLEQENQSPPREDAGSIPGVTGVNPAPVEPLGAPGIDPDLAAGAPPEEEAYEEIEDWERADDFAEDDLVDDGASAGVGEAGYAVRGRRGRDPHEAHKDRGRVVQFLVAVWAELQRVQWPNRQALVTLTGVVLGFVLIAGGYLGLLDAVFSELIQAIL